MEDTIIENTPTVETPVQPEVAPEAVDTVVAPENANAAVSEEALEATPEASVEDVSVVPEEIPVSDEAIAA